MTSTQSKPLGQKRSGVSLMAALCMAFIAFSQVAHCQYFATMDYSKTKKQDHFEDDEEKSAVD